MHDELSQARARGRTAGAARATPEDPHTGRVLDGRYRIGGRIARGGMASVYEALDLRLDRTVAVKIMHPGLGDAGAGQEEFAARFVREARSAARLSHPNVVSVFDQGLDGTGDGDVLFIAMELVPGHTLRDTIAKESPMSPERALALLDPVLSALASAHRAGLVHRDVKPENVLIADDGRIKVADFGLAKAVSADTQHTATNGVLIGTVSYLAPELVVDGHADARADVYAAGVILFELLTGRKPHTGDTPIAVAYKHVHEDVPPPSSQVPGVPDYVDALVARATCRDRTLRPADAGVLLHHAHRVTQALHAGVRADPELVADLLPSARIDTTPEPVSRLWDSSPFAHDVTDRESTSVIEQRAAGPTPPRAARPARVPKARPPRRRRGMVLLLLAALLATAVGGGAYWFGWARYTTTPSVIGLEQAAAEAELAEAGLQVEVADPVYSERVPEGEVIATDPGAGEQILPDGTVTLTVSLGPERYDVPDLRGMTVEEAEAALSDRRLLLGKQAQRWSEKVDKGEIIRTEPAFGSRAARDLPVDSTVDVVVSKGPEPIQVESWVGRDVGEARDALRSLGLKVDVVGREHSDTVAEGGIIDQDPTEGTLYRGDTVELVVSQGPELVEVPSVRYSATDDVVAELEGLGFEVQVEQAEIYLNGAVAWRTDPDAGELVPEGSTITLYVV